MGIFFRHTNANVAGISMIRVQIESPFAGADPEYLVRALRDSLQRGEAPFASHAIYTQALDDTKPMEREQGIRAGFEYLKVAEKVAVYRDLGISDGMRRGIREAKKRGIPVVYRSINE